jgi:hypothetical protein
MGQLAVPMMIGAAVGGGSKLLQGKGLGSILKGAAVGGALGGATGGLMGGASGITGAAGGTASSQGAGGLLGATGAAGTGASLAVPTIAQSIAPEALAGTIESSGMVFNPATGSYLSPESYLAASSSAPIYTGTGSMLDKFTTGAQSVGSNFSNTFADGVGIDNLKGAAQVASMYQPTPLQSAPSGTIKVGQAPTGDIYDALRQYGYTMPKRRETNFSLLG